jgi:hypothetical protein
MNLPGDGGNKLLWNVDQSLPDYMVLHPIWQLSSYSSPWEPQISPFKPVLGVIHHPDDGGSKFLWNLGHCVPDYTVLHPGRHKSSPVGLILIQLNLYHFHDLTTFFLRSVFILLSNVHLDLASGPFSSGFPTKILCAFLLSFSCVLTLHAPPFSFSFI